MEREEFTGKYLDGWVSRRFVIPIRKRDKGSLLVIRGRRSYYLANLTIFIYVNGKLIHEERNPEGEFTISVEIPAMNHGDVEIVASDVFVPKELGLNEDVRKLSFLLDHFSLSNLSDERQSYSHLFDFSLSKKIYFMDVWDRLLPLLPDHYKVPDKEVFHPLLDSKWWEQIQPSMSSSIRGTVYDKFTGTALQKAAVQVIGSERKKIAETTVDHLGRFQLDGVPAGDYAITAVSEHYGEQEIKVHADGYGKCINIPLLPLA
jgi:hypothetical protein